jgi:hypothetical protein
VRKAGGSSDRISEPYPEVVTKVPGTGQSPCTCDDITHHRLVNCLLERAYERSPLLLMMTSPASGNLTADAHSRKSCAPSCVHAFRGRHAYPYLPPVSTQQAAKLSGKG